MNELTIRRPGSRELTPEQNAAYGLLCAGAERLRHHDRAAAEALRVQTCSLDTVQRGVPVVVTAAYDLIETILRNEIVDARGECTCWLTAARQALTIRNLVSEAMLTHAVASLASHPGVTAPTRRQVNAEFGRRRAETAPKAMSAFVISMASAAELVDAAVVGGVMASAMIQDVLEMVAGGPLGHD